MKKLLGIVVLGLLWCNVGFASEAGGQRLRNENSILTHQGVFPVPTILIVL